MVSATHDDGLSRWRTAIEQAYRDNITDVTWEYLTGETYVAELEDGIRSVESVVAVLHQLNRVAPAAQARQRRRVLGSGAPDALFAGLNSRMQAVAEVIAWRASRSTPVVGFRNRWLPDGLVAGDSVTGWVDETYHRHLPGNWPAQPGPAQANNMRGQFALWPHKHLAVEWLDSEQQTTRIWCVPTRGPLAELSQLATDLAEQWDWHPALATNFVLTGETPARPGVRGLEFRTRRGSGANFGSYQFMSVGCVVDVETTPEQLAGWWRGVRTAIGISGRKPLGEKAIRLALFALAVDDETTTYRQDMERWNAQVPDEWRYDDYRNFRTAALSAVEALNNPAAGCTVP